MPVYEIAYLRRQILWTVNLDGTRDGETESDRTYQEVREGSLVVGFLKQGFQIWRALARMIDFWLESSTSHELAQL